jgi:hypothetical protein
MVKSQDQKSPVTMGELLISALATNDVLAKLIIDKCIITQQESLPTIAEERATYQRMLTSHGNEDRLTSLERSSGR